jgi:uncharacterized glyoxalase superfamily protein PhnB
MLGAGGEAMPKIPRPPGHQTLTPAFMVQNAGRVIGFLEKAFGGRVVDRYDGPGGSVMHAEVMIGDCVVMLGDVAPGAQARPASLSYYVDDGPAVDAAYRRALDAGATSLREPANQFYGYRSATVSDVGGNHWTICAVVEQLTSEQIQERMAKMAQS